MPSWRDDKMLELASQLTYSPAEKRREQLQAAIELLPDIDPAKTYPWDLVYYRITAIQLRAHSEHTLVGKVLRADLASLIEFLSDTLALRVEDAGGDGDAVLELELVTRKFNVSTKTIQRWRKQGLIALKYLYPDGRRRLGFLESAVARFAALNKERIERSAAFKQLSDEEKARIIELARQMISHAPGSARPGIKELSRSIGKHLNRAPETIRYTLRRYDREHPESPLFVENGGEGRRESQGLTEARPAAAATVQEVYRVLEDAAQAGAPATLERIDYIANPLFAHPDAENIILEVLPAEALARARATVSAGINAATTDVYMARMPRDLPAFLQDIFRQPLMPHELETDAFRRMNYLKYKAAQLQLEIAAQGAEGDPASGCQKKAALESLLQQAGTIKNQILQSNLRVAVHVARKHQRIDRPLMELVSDATIWLMRAVEKFDFARPARFSTYASYAIMKNFARDRAEQLTRRDRHLLTGQEEIISALGDRQENAIGEQMDAAHLQAELLAVFQELTERERELLSSRYGLDQSKPALSLAQLGDKMGITKARVRQLEARALCKLRGLLQARRDKLQKTSRGG